MERKPILKQYLHNERFHFMGLGVAWLLLHGVLFYKFGIVTSFEAAKYIEQAKLLTDTGTYSTGNFIFYSTEILLIAFCLKLKIGLWFAVLVQLIANAFSVYFFYRLTQRITSRHMVAFVASLVFLCMFFYHLYNVHLFTESLFFSLSIFYTWFLFTAKRLSFSFILTFILFLSVLSLTRPTGILFLPATLFFIIFRFGKNKALPLFFLSIAVGLILFYFLLNAALNSGGELDFLLPYAEEHIICGVPNVQQAHAISMPVNKNSVQGLWYVIKNNNELFVRLAKERFLAFWGVQRSFYSSGHNLFVAVYFYSLYILIVLGLRKMFRYRLPEAVFMITYIFLVMLTVLLSCDEWHNRFIYSILPFLLLLASGLFAKPTRVDE